MLTLIGARGLVRINKASGCVVGIAAGVFVWAQVDGVRVTLHEFESAEQAEAGMKVVADTIHAIGINDNIEGCLVDLRADQPELPTWFVGSSLTEGL